MALGLCDMDTPYSKKKSVSKRVGHTDTRVDTPTDTSCLDHNLFGIAFRKFSILIHVIQPY
ncbi:hypothetical protein GIB67_019374 [Kingdonia uniflora]|uniref:Uncharacterized protein n=1 Tax=Kingdonia uniflora TaxID=39325 RepID=A0A7J7M1L8_9MAGN|nr:hypothetical protein GIB67_019374 [Kingdonia uniflora]